MNQILEEALDMLHGEAIIKCHEGAASDVNARVINVVEEGYWSGSRLWREEVLDQVLEEMPCG